MGDAADKLPFFRLLAEDGEAPRVEFEITPDNEGALRAFVRRIPNLRGDQGEQGADGASIQGARGEPGRRGRRGERGLIPDHEAATVEGGFTIRFQQPGGGWGEPLEVRQGEVGPQGIPGEKGDTGDVGPQGDKGDEGDEGEKGDDGDKGTKGERGEPGPMGGRGGRSASANQIWDVIELVGTDLIFRRSTAGPLGPSTTVDLSSLAQGGLAGLGIWRYRTETTEPPASGQIRFNNSVIASATAVFINDTNVGGSDLSAFLGALDPGDLIYIQQDDDADNFVIVETGTITDDGTHFDIAIANIVVQGVPFTQNTDVRLVVTVSGGGAVLALDGLTDVTITSPATGDHLVKSAGDWINQQPQVQREWFEQMGRFGFVSSDFLEPPGGLQADGIQAIAAGAGSSVSTPTAGYDFTDHPGVWGLNTGATAAGRVFLLSQFPGGFHVGVGALTRFGAFFQAPAVLSDAANRFVLRAGFTSMALPNTINQGITFEYQDNQNGGRWQAICDDAPGVETSVDTGVTVVASTYYLLEFEVNAAGTSVEFFIDSVSVATVATNIPAGTGFSHFISIHIMKLVGTANRAPYADAYYFYQEVTR